MTLRYSFTILLPLLFSLAVRGQDNAADGYVLPGVIVNNDTIAHYEAKQMVVLPPAATPNADDVRKFKRLVKNLKVVYPYAKIGKQVFYEVQQALDTITRKKDKKTYIKSREKELMARYASELKHLSVVQGQLLMKLVNRELDKTSYEVIKEMKGSFQAVMWQQLARIFGSDLKATYDPTGEDAMIEQVLILIDAGSL